MAIYKLIVYNPVFIFTALLFLSGYVLQQQTVRSIQAAIKPPPVTSTPTAITSRVVAKPFGAPYEVSLNDKFLPVNKPRGGWAKVAYVQLVRTHLQVCSIIIVFAELERQDCLARKVIMYPKEWHFRPTGHGRPDMQVERSLRLLQNAQNQYRVELRPVDRVHDTDKGWFKTKLPC